MRNSDFMPLVAVVFVFLCNHTWGRRGRVSTGPLLRMNRSMRVYGVA